MKNPEDVFRQTRTVAQWRQPLHVDYPGLFEAMSGVLESRGMEEWTEAAHRAVSACRLEGLAEDPGLLAFALIWRAQTRALLDLLLEMEHRLDRLSPEDRENSIRGIDLSFEDRPLEIGPAVFEDPVNLPLIRDVMTAFSTWLEACGLPEYGAVNAPLRLDEYFAWRLDWEWRENYHYYKPLSRSLNTLFTSPPSPERSWLSYNLHIRKKILAPLFGVNLFNIKQWHVRLRAWRFQLGEGPASTVDDLCRPDGFQKKWEKLVVDPYAEIVDWVEQDDPGDNLRFMAGAAGSGVSIFGHWFAGHLIRTKKAQPLLIPMEHFDYSGGLMQSIGRYAGLCGLFEDNPVENHHFQSPLVIIFSHLDALSRPGENQAGTARRFFREVVVLLRQARELGRPLMVLVTGWTTVLEALHYEMPPEALIYNLLPYFIPEEERSDFFDPEGLLNQDQRETWWLNAGLNGLPEKLRDAGPEFQRMTAQPLTNYLTALSYLRGQLDFSHSLNLNHVAEDQLTTVWERTFDPRRSIQQQYFMDEQNFILTLQAAAVLIWHNLKRTVTVGELREYFRMTGLGQGCDSFVEQARSGVTGIIAVWTPLAGKMTIGDEDILEFTHPSFQRLLAAKRILTELRVLCQEVRRNSNDFFTGLDLAGALVRWASLCGPAPFDQGLLNSLNGQIRLEKKQDVEAWQELVCRMIDHVVKHGPPMDRVPHNLSFREKCIKARNAEEALLIVQHACARAAGKQGRIAWPESSSAAGWIKRLQGPRFGSENYLLLNCLGGLNLADCELSALDLWGANLADSILSGASLKMACLSDSDLRKARMDGADLTGSNLSGADLRQAELRRAILDEANLRGADLRQADLTGARLREADLRGADLQGASLLRANLAGALLRGANLDRADLRQADLGGVDPNDVRTT